MAVLLLLGGCEPQLDAKVLQTKIAAEVAEQLKLKPEDVAVSCPGEVSGKEGEQVKCEVLLSVSATLTAQAAQQDPAPTPEAITQQVDARLSTAATKVLADSAAHPFERLHKMAPLQRQRAEAVVTVTGRGQVTWTLQNITPIPQ